jgi:hypothetical protein
MARTDYALHARLVRVEESIAALAEGQKLLLAAMTDLVKGRARVSEPVVEVKASRRSRADRVAEANPLIRPERAKSGRMCACGRSMSKERNGTKVAGKVVCHYCWTHR